MLHSIDEVRRVCIEHPELIENFKPLITPLVNNEHPWVQKEASKSLRIFEMVKKYYVEHGKRGKSVRDSASSISNIDDYIELLFSILNKKKDFKEKVLDLYVKNKINLPEEPPTIKDQLLFIIEGHSTTYLEKLFIPQEVVQIALTVGIDITDISDNFELIALEIYKALGFKPNRGDYLEF